MAEMHADEVGGLGQDRDFERRIRRAGMFVSAALIAGLAWWGGTLVLRDVTGVPVIAAEQPQFRTEPTDPGGQIAAHQGLAVTQVASEGTAATEVDAVVVAPVEEEVALPDPGQSATVQADALLGDEAINAAVTLALGGAVEEVAAEETPQAEPSTGMLRPRLRPANLHLAAAAQPSAAETVSLPSSAAVVTGPMVQLGAYDSSAIAQDVWDRLSARFAASLSGRPYFVMEAVVSGRTYHRLRVGGFEARADANRFCQVMEAEGVDCVPVSGG